MATPWDRQREGLCPSARAARPPLLFLDADGVFLARRQSCTPCATAAKQTATRWCGALTRQLGSRRCAVGIYRTNRGPSPFLGVPTRGATLQLFADSSICC
eukprot:354837-Chlamydomonas_euryale.AAC.9